MFLSAATQTSEATELRLKGFVLSVWEHLETIPTHRNCFTIRSFLQPETPVLFKEKLKLNIQSLL